jgi:alanyl-tRNA synthetase
LDIDVVGQTERHFTFFEMLGNFSFGDYFKTEAIPYAWSLVTETLGIEADRLWVTVHDSDDEAEEIWVDSVGVSRDRLQRMGDDNFWKMGDTGPCGPCSELYVDRGEAYGEPGGPVRGGAERFVEIWNLVFMQYNRWPDGSLADLPRRSIDTGAGLERILPVVQNVRSPFETDLLIPILHTAEELTGRSYGADPVVDVSLRILADHARGMSMLIADGVLPGNEGRGYVLRRIIRRAVRRAHQLGVAEPVTPRLVASVVDVLGQAYPALEAQADLVSATVEREEGNFRRTLESGSSILEEELQRGSGRIPGAVAFRLHDTHGFPIELTVEMAAEAGAEVDLEGFRQEMGLQRERAKKAALAKRSSIGEEASYRELLENFGSTRFDGYATYEEPCQVLAVFGGATPGQVEIVLDRTPFYPESGGQVGDTGFITTETGRATVLDTQNILPGLIGHRATLMGEVFPGQEALAVIDASRREAIRRNHTGTHLLHSALRQVLGEHVRQQGSLVAPDHLRFDFSHHGAVRPEELEAVVAIANEDVLSDAPVEVLEMPKQEAEALGALAFFGEKYGSEVRVVRAGSHSTELCGGTHVAALGMIGPISVLSEASIGSNTRRIEATTGFGSLALAGERQRTLQRAAGVLRVEPDGLIDALERLVERQRNSEKELQRLRGVSLEATATEFAHKAIDGVVVVRVDGQAPDQLRDLAQAIRRHSGINVAVIGGSPDGEKATLAAATGGEPHAGELVKSLAALVGGGGGGSAVLAVAGGRDVSALDDALGAARQQLAAH